MEYKWNDRNKEIVYLNTELLNPENETIVIAPLELVKPRQENQVYSWLCLEEFEEKQYICSEYLQHPFPLFFLKQTLSSAGGELVPL